MHALPCLAHHDASAGCAGRAWPASKPEMLRSCRNLVLSPAERRTQSGTMRRSRPRLRNCESSLSLERSRRSWRSRGGKVPARSRTTHHLGIGEHHAPATVEPKPAPRGRFDRKLLARRQTGNLKLVSLNRSLLGHRLAATVFGFRVGLVKMLIRNPFIGATNDLKRTACRGSTCADLDVRPLG